jgi:hypothetical protein
MDVGIKGKLLSSRSKQLGWTLLPNNGWWAADLKVGRRTAAVLAFAIFGTALAFANTCRCKDVRVVFVLARAHYRLV